MKRISFPAPGLIRLPTPSLPSPFNTHGDWVYNGARLRAVTILGGQETTVEPTTPFSPSSPSFFTNKTNVQLDRENAINEFEQSQLNVLTNPA